VFRPQFHARLGEAGKTRESPAVLCHSAANRHPKARRAVHVPTGVERTAQAANLGGNSSFDPRRRAAGDRKL